MSTLTHPHLPAPAPGEVEELVDDTAARLGRAVLLLDQRFEVRAYSRHAAGVDDARRASILHRQADPELACWLEDRGVRHATAPLRVPANPEFGMRARVCAPARCDGFLVGLLWVVDDALTDEDLAVLTAAAEAAAPLLYRERVLLDARHARELELAAALLGAGDDATATAAAAGLQALGVLTARAPLTAVVACCPPAGANHAPIAAALRRARRGLHQGTCATALLGGLPALLVSSPPGRDGAADHLARALHDELTAATPARWAVGIGPVADQPAGARRSAAAALEAARLALSDVVDGPVARWAQLGAWAALGPLARVPGAEDTLPAALARLDATRDGAVLLETLEAWLDHGGDTQRAADALHLHRTSLRARLSRVEREGEVDLRDGEQRLALHLGLRLRRLLAAAQAGDGARSATAAQALAPRASASTSAHAEA